MHRIKDALPALTLLAVLIAAWWLAVILTHSVIFPTPWGIVTGTWELLRNGTLWQHIGASLMRVGAGFGLAVCLALPLGLWMGWVRGAYRTNFLFLKLAQQFCLQIHRQFADLIEENRASLGGS